MILKCLSSSSKGNCYILDTGAGKLIIECGVSFKEIRKALGFDLSDVVGAIVSHSHLDHACGVKDAMKAGIEVYMSQGTAMSLGLSHHRLNIVEEGKQFDVGDFTILAFPTEHDTLGSLGFLIYHKPTKTRTLFATDTYYLKNKFNGLNYILIESNYCKDTLDSNIEAGYIPFSLKNRLLESHFSLENVKGFLSANDMTRVQKIVLIHLSDSNSDAERMVREIRELTTKSVEIAEPGKEIDLVLCPF